ncbi:hypothetical protein J437_LFUL009917 [Ladona fulva]|uniref:CRAL-TRIO domain-containing protein n=1 Tax=Ladona fulva TaxID=123851 RepID=A0A8K0KE51_LADFU|nr:hypothetical protein J437_LFUL009917 [Ladona fulva]
MAVRDTICARPWVGSDIQEGGGGGDSVLTALQEKIAMVALKELREDPSGRRQTLELMRDWAKKNQNIKEGRFGIAKWWQFHQVSLDSPPEPDLTTSPGLSLFIGLVSLPLGQVYGSSLRDQSGISFNFFSDDSFLLRFLRVKKFSVPMAQQMLLKYLHFRNVYSNLCLGLANMQPTVYELLKSGYLFSLPQRDRLGRRVIFADASKLDPFKYSNSDMAKAHLLVYESLLEEEENQVLGFTHIGDLKGICAAHLTLWSPSEFASIVKLGEQAVPMRHKEIHLINMPTGFKVAYDFCKGLLSEKIRNRFNMHSSLPELHQSVDPKILPKEYGGSIPMAEMIGS